MRSSLICGCLGLISISSLAGCGLFGSCRDDACNGRPVARMVVRNGVVVAQNPSGTTTTTTTTTISGSSRPIAAPTEQIVVAETPKQLPNADKLPVIPLVPMAPETAPTKIDTVARIAPERSGVLSQDTIPTVVDPSVASRPDGDNDPRAKEKTNSLSSEQIQCGHSEDFKAVTGKVQMWRGTVRLRYAPVDQEDKYGGFVVLEGDAELTKMRDGQHIRIRGVLIAPENRNAAAHFRVQALEILD